LIQTDTESALLEEGLQNKIEPYRPEQTLHGSMDDIDCKTDSFEMIGDSAIDVIQILREK
jgi:hypothetical protein